MQSQSPSPLAPPPPQPTAADVEVELQRRLVMLRLLQEQRVRRSASWFYWLAGFSALNSVLAHAGSTFQFFGLGLTELIDFFALGLRDKLGGGVHVVAAGLDLAIVGTWIGIGMWARQRSTAAFGVGMALFAVDALILLPLGDWLGIAFHAYALFAIYGGFQASQALKQNR
ncbi:MAG: hypothetical protein JST54_08315 [Deltaproteobacteria bacterium]|nr:hypothetical protein [Deltaproteobacteria bacterium]